jgi:deoxyribodipyrimidine photo-lyase
MGGASRWWLHGSLRALAADLHRLGAPLVLRRGKCATVVAAFAAEVGAGAVYCTRHVEPFWNTAEQVLDSRLQRADIACAAFQGRPC